MDGGLIAFTMKNPIPMLSMTETASISMRDRPETNELVRLKCALKNPEYSAVSIILSFAVLCTKKVLILNKSLFFMFYN